MVLLTHLSTLDCNTTFVFNQRECIGTKQLFIELKLSALRRERCWSSIQIILVIVYMTTILGFADKWHNVRSSIDSL